MNETNKNITLNTDIRLVGMELERLLSIFSRIQGGGTPASDNTKTYVKKTIKDYYDTIL